tara:strand:+ start:694 stop:2076 length:1383 start_codon:yes stop_codon:yes gene_type:complete
MNELFEQLKGFIHFNTISSLAIAFGLLALLGLLLSFGKRLDSAMKLERFGIPIALLFGVFGILFGPYGTLPLLTQSVTDIWTQLPSPLLTLVFASLMLGRPIPRANSLWQPVASQALLGFLLGFGQYLVGGLAVLIILIPYFHVNPLMGCLIEVGFEGGHGAASIMGNSFQKLGFSSGLDLGLAMATVGLLSSTLLGSLLVIIARMRGWVVIQNQEPSEDSKNLDNSFNLLSQFKAICINLGLVGCAVSFGLGMLALIRSFTPFLGDVFKEAVLVFPVFPLALLGSFFIRFVLEKFKLEHFSSSIIQREIGVISTDLLIATAMAGLNLPLLINYWLPITVLALAGLSWNLVGMFVFARLFFRDNWFERSLTEFGNATGVAASGLLLLRLADPRDLTKTLPIFSIKQLFLQPLLSGGVITVFAPLVINRIGLLEWTELCGSITFAIILLAFLLNNNSFETT